jgi:hypothetical protein
MTEISILIFLITTLCGLIYSLGRKRGKEKIENKNNKAYNKKSITTQKKRNEVNKKDDDNLIASYIRLLNKSKPR